jgi:hypothetical protein
MVNAYRAHEPAVTTGIVVGEPNIVINRTPTAEVITLQSILAGSLARGLRRPRSAFL